MKEIVKSIDKSNLALTIVLKTLIYIAWFTFAFLFLIYIEGTLTDDKIFFLFIWLMGVYVARNILKYFYRRIVNKSYYNLKHSIEMHYFEKLRYLKSKDIRTINREELANNILELSYHFSKSISDIGEYIIPTFIGVGLLLYGCFRIHTLLGVSILLSLLLLLGIRYFLICKKGNLETNNYNDLLKDFVLKLDTIKKLNNFEYCKKRLEKNKENDICLLTNKDTSVDFIFSNGIGLLLCGIFACIFFFVKNNITRLGYLIFFIVIMLKLKSLLYEVCLSFFNIKKAKQKHRKVDLYYQDLEEYQYVKQFKAVQIKDGKCKYSTSNVTIHIPNFELVSGDSVSIMGKSGEGKSTILHILNGMLKLDEGLLTFDSKEDKKALDAVYIAKDMCFFKMSLRENLNLSAKKTDEELMTMLKELDLLSFFNTLPKGLDTIMDNQYIKINSTELLRLNLIRAINLDKNVYFLDEPTFDMNIEEEKLVAQQIKKYLSKKTFIIVTHRPLLTTICKKHYFMKEHTLLENEPLL